MESELKKKNLRRRRRSLRIRQTLKGTSQRPRMSVFRSNLYVSVQFIDDEKQVTVVGVSTANKETAKLCQGKKGVSVGKALGEYAGKLALEAGITEVVFDRGFYTYHGVVAAIADAAREAGLKF